MKKWLLILGMITCMIGLAACGSEAGNVTGPVSEEEAVEFGEQTVNSIYQIYSMGAEADYAENEVAYNGIQSFAGAMSDIGNYLGTEGGTVEFSEDETIIRININGSDHSAVAEIVLDDTLAYTSIATNVNYSTGEKMEKAALNTLLGMGTVFVVLILISLIISLFSFIPKLTAKKKEPQKAQAEKANDVVAQISEKEELSDDLELVAVISAAVAAYEGSGSTDGFVVRSIRKAHKK